MNFKKIIIIAVIAVALISAGFFAYKTFSSPKKNTTTTKSKTESGAEATPAPTAALAAKPGQTASGVDSILPHGTKLDFDTVKKFNPTGRLFPYPTVKAEETGLQLNEIVSQ